MRQSVYSAPLSKNQTLVNKYKQYNSPDVSRIRQHYGRFDDPRYYESITHGIKSDDEQGVSHLFKKLINK
jgi:hypothetical protein